MIRIILPQHLRTLARVDGEVTLDLSNEVTTRAILDALEASYPVLRGTIRDHVTQRRRPFVRFFACEEDVSHDSPDTPLPAAVASGDEPFLVVGAMAVIRYAERNGTRRPWLVQLMARRTTKVAAVALANQTARMIWALMTGGERYREPVIR